MPKIAAERSALAVQKLTTKGLFRVGGVPGLCLQVKIPLVRSWILRTSVSGRQKYFGVGNYPTFSLSGARAKAREYVEMIGNGLNPITARREAAEKLVDIKENTTTFDECVIEYLQAHVAIMKNPKHHPHVKSH